MIPTVVAAVLIFARLGGLFMVLPGFSSQAIPGMARLGAALPLTVLLLPAAPEAPIPATLSQLLLAVGAEALLGLAMGTAVSLIFGVIGIAGDLIATQSGMHMAAMLDPLTMGQPGAVGVLATWLGTSVFFGAGLHLQCLTALADTLHALPPGSVVDPTLSATILVPEAGYALAAGATLAGPLTILVFTVNLALSILGRMAPNLQLFFAIGPSVTVVASLGLLALTLPSLFSAWMAMMPEAVAAIGQLAELAAPR